MEFRLKYDHTYRELQAENQFQFIFDVLITLLFHNNNVKLKKRKKEKEKKGTSGSYWKPTSSLPTL